MNTVGNLHRSSLAIALFCLGPGLDDAVSGPPHDQVEPPTVDLNSIERTPPDSCSISEFGAYPSILFDDQPSYSDPLLLAYGGGRIEAFIRRDRDLIALASEDGGHTWSEPEPPFPDHPFSVRYGAVVQHRTAHVIWTNYQVGEFGETYTVWHSVLEHQQELSRELITDGRVRGVMDVMLIGDEPAALLWHSSLDLEMSVAVRRSDGWVESAHLLIPRASIEDLGFGVGPDSELVVVYEGNDSLMTAVSSDLGQTWNQFVLVEEAVVGFVAVGKEARDGYVDLAWCERDAVTSLYILKVGKLEVDGDARLSSVREIKARGARTSLYKPRFVYPGGEATLVYAEYDHDTFDLNLCLDRDPWSDEPGERVQINDRPGAVRAASRWTHSVVALEEGYVAAWNQWNEDPIQIVATRTSVDAHCRSMTGWVADGHRTRFFVGQTGSSESRSTIQGG